MRRNGLSQEATRALVGIAAGRNTLAHIVDGLGLTGVQALELVNDLVRDGYLIPEGDRYLGLLTYRLTEKGINFVKQELEQEGESWALVRQQGLQSRDLYILERLNELNSRLNRGVTTDELYEAVKERIPDAADFSQRLLYLVDRDLVRWKGVLRAYALITTSGRELLRKEPLGNWRSGVK